MSLADEAEILKLIHRAAHAFDSAQFDEFASIFARATTNIGGLAAPIVGADGVRAFVRDRLILHRGKPRTQHRISNTVITVDETARTAAATSYVLVIQGLDGVITPILAGRYNDTFASEGAGWYFTSRTGSDGMVGDLSRHLRP